MRTLGSLVLSFFFFGTFFPFKAAHASDVRKEKPTPKLHFLLVQYHELQNYDPQAIMNKWQGKVLNQSEQTQIRTSSDQGAMYGNGTGIYPESSYMYPQTPQSTAAPHMYAQPSVPSSLQGPLYGPVYPINPGYQYQSAPYPSYPVYPSYPQQTFPQPGYPQPCFCT